jgi:hypothetical protein
MNWREDDLRRALARREPPEGFAERVVARLSEARPPARRWPRWLAAAACLLVLSGAAAEWQRERVRRAEQAKEQVLLALRITSTHLRTAQQRVLAIGTARDSERSETR